MTSQIIHVVVGLYTCWILIKLCYGGFACLSSPCINGICIDDVNSTYSCYCIDGFTGIQCQTNWNECWSSPCKNGGTCTDGIASYNCTCIDGFVGADCEINYDECASNPCSNNGTCIDVDNGYECMCSPGYEGINCEIDIAVCNITGSDRCANGGTCIEGRGFTFFCNCTPGWKGPFCEDQVNECESSPCQNGGICIDLIATYACACHFGYTGSNCEESILLCNDNPCENEALCLMEDDRLVCYCVPDYHGDRCQYQYDECQLGPRCMNGGTCIDGIDSFICSCPPDLTGVLCECLILSNDTYDCTYIAPTTTTISTTLPSTISTTISHTVPEFSTISSTNSTQPYFTFSTEILELSSFTVPKTFPSITTEYETSTPITLYQTTEYFPGTTDIVQNITSVFTTAQRENTTDRTLTSVSSRLPKDTVTIVPVTGFSTVPTTVVKEITTKESFPGKATTSSYNKSSLPDVTESEIVTFFTVKPTSILTTKILPRTTIGEETTMETIFLSSTTTDLITTEYPVKNKTTTPGIVDCTKYPCKNGGSCIHKLEGPKCVCKFNYEGHYCETELIIENAAFMGQSYLLHHIDSKSSIKIELRAKTLASSGLIFYSNIGKSAYMSLYLLDNLLKFQFSCGLQTMVLCEMDLLVNNGNEFKIQAHLEYSHNRSHCNATVRLNDSLTMSGDQKAVFNIFDLSDSWIHFGKILQHIHNQLAEITGFIGCINSLKVNDMRTEIFNNAKDGFEISDCNSLVCLSNPCYNNGICIENDGKWSCLCTNGFVGQTCVQSICENNPCMYGASCVPYTSGFLCLCQFGKHGYLCEQDLEITEPSFSSTIHGMSSFSAHTISKSVANNMEIEFNFIPDTVEQIALLLFIGQDGPHDVLSDHLAVSFVKGYIMLTWNLGSGPRRIFTTKPLKMFPSKEHTVRIGRQGRRAWIMVDNMTNVTGRSPGKQEQLDVQPIIYLGGYEKTNFSTLPHDLPLHTGFSGCIYNVYITVGDFSVPLLNTKAKFGRSVGQCKTSECTNYVCQNGGVCLQYGPTFTCLCADGWFGHFCTIKYNPCDSTRHKCSLDSTCVPLADSYECDCPLGKSGKYCEKYENLSDVHFSGKRSYLKIHTSSIIQATLFNIEMQIRPLSDQGLICFMGDGRKYISIYLQGGVMEFRLFSTEIEQSSESPILIVRSRQVLRIGEWYTIKVGKQGRKVYIETDEKISANILSTTNSFRLDLTNSLYLGGLPDLANLPRDASTGYPASFSGCIRQLKVNDRHISLNTSTVSESRNIDDCDGTPCGGDICLNGGTCWLDSQIKPHCSCSKYYSGENCQTKISCQELNCQNDGRCIQQKDDVDGVYKCTCPLGWMGDFCEKVISQPLKSPYLMGSNSYILVETRNKKANKIGVASSSLQNMDWFGISYIHINFSTPEPDGMLLWTQNGPKFFGIGVDQGILKITWQESNVVIYDISTYGIITDGAWHSLTLLFDYGNMTLYIDEKEIPLPKPKIDNNFQEEGDEDDTPFTDGTFYVGGFPDNQSIHQETNGLYVKHFKGCISELSFERDEEINDFSIYHGQHVDKCYITP